MSGTRSAGELGGAYRRGQAAPSQVLEAALSSIAASDRRTPRLNAFLALCPVDARAAARAADERFRRRQPLGPLDGIPVAIKDELHVAGAATTCGSRIFGGRPEPEDATCVARLRRAGALIVGKTGLHELGGGSTGVNPHHGPVRNPHDPSRITGGSSSGSAAAVAAGLVPIALGTDAGGSVRIPASLCGVPGIKPTFGRISRRGMPRMVWSLDHVGLIGRTTADLAECLRTVAGPDELDEDTLGLPAPPLDETLSPGLLDGASVAGMRLAVVRAAVDESDPAVAVAVRRAIARLGEAGARITEVTVEHLALAPAMGVVILGCEGASAYEEDFDERGDRFGAEMRLLIAAARQIPAVDYLRAQRLRTLLRRALDGALADCDALMLPTTACTAAPIRDAALADGEIDGGLSDALSRFTFPASLTGLPAGTVPCGLDGDGLPIGLQVIGGAFDEPTVLRVMAACERLLPPLPPPRIAFDLLAAGAV